MIERMRNISKLKFFYPSYHTTIGEKNILNTRKYDHYSACLRTLLEICLLEWGDGREMDWIKNATYPLKVPSVLIMQGERKECSGMMKVFGQD